MNKYMSVILKKSGLFSVILFWGLCQVLSSGLPASRAVTETAATGAFIALSTDSTTVKKGEVFTVVCRVTAATGVLESDFYVDYNTSVLEFVEGGTRAKKEVGGVHIQSVDNTDSPVRRTFSLQFLSKKEGSATVFIRDGAHVMDGEGNPLSVQSSRIELVVNETGEPGDEPAGGDPGDGATPSPGPEDRTPPPANAGSENRVKSLTTNADQMVPAFDPEVETYEATVGPDEETFFINYILADENAHAKIKGNTGLKYGKNKVKLIVTAENGRKKTYVFLVTRMEEGDGQDTSAEAVTPAAVNTDLPLDKEGNNGYSIVLYIIIVLLAVFSVAMVVLVRRQRHELDNFYLEEAEREKYSETENDSRGGEGGIEGREIRGEDGDFRYRN